MDVTFCGGTKMISILSIIESMHDIEKRGMKHGKEQGKLAGLQTIERHSIIQQLNEKVGEVNQFSIKLIHALETEQAILLEKEVINFSSITDLEKWLLNQSKSASDLSVELNEIEKNGELKGKQELTIQLLNQRFGEIDLPLIEQIRNLSPEQLEKLTGILLTLPTVTALEQWLQSKQKLVEQE